MRREDAQSITTLLPHPMPWASSLGNKQMSETELEKIKSEQLSILKMTKTTFLG